MFNFTLRIYQDLDRHPTLSDLSNITISDITLISKPSKHGDICFHNGNKKKFKYKLSTSKPFYKVAGSLNYPILAFKGDYIDIIVENFPRFPAFYQNEIAAKNYLNGFGYTNYLNKGFPHQLNYRKIEIIH